MVSALDSRSSGTGLSPGREYCVVFLGKTQKITLTVQLSTQVYKCRDRAASFRVGGG